MIMKKEKEELAKELAEKFEDFQKKSGFRATFDEVNRFFYLEDLIFSAGYVSERFSRQMINRMIDTFGSWMNEIHGWLFPAPQDLLHQTEGRKLTPEDTAKLKKLMGHVMYFVRKNKRLSFSDAEPKEEGEFVDEMVDFKNNEFKPTILYFNDKFEKAWKE
jgi:hypothetical protein